MSLKRSSRALLFALTCILATLIPFTASASARASVDRSTISTGEIVRLVIETDGEPDSGPDLSGLTSDFQIVDRRTSRSVSVVNGQRSERHTLTLGLLPLRTGELLIPSVRIGKDTTAPLRLLVTEQNPESAGPSGERRVQSGGSPELLPSPSAFLEVTLDPSRVRVGQQMILTAKVFADGPMRRARLHDPKIPNAEVLPLGEDRYQEQPGGQSRQVYERRYALFPRAPGHLQIGSLRFEGWGSDASGAGIDYPSMGRPVNARSEPLSAEVLQILEGPQTGRWLPAQGLTLSEPGPEIYSVQVGQPVVRRISLRAEGIMAKDLPVPTVQAPYQLAKRQLQPRLWDERRPYGVIGIRQEIIELTPREPGRYRLPPLSLEWWNTAKQRWETATLPAKELVASSVPSQDAWPAAGTVEDGPQPLPRDVPEKPAQTEAPMETSSDESDAPIGLWIGIGAALGLAWIIKIAAARRRRSQEPALAAEATNLDSNLPEPTVTSEEIDPLQDRIEAVRAAYESGNAAIAREALLAWAAQALTEPAPSNLARLAQRCQEPLRSQILLLEEAFFSPMPAAWDEQPVWKQLKGFVPAPPQEPASFRIGKPIRRRSKKTEAD